MLSDAEADDRFCLKVNQGDRITALLDGPASGVDFDLFLKMDHPPALFDYDARSVTPLSDEACHLTAASAGTLYGWVQSLSGTGDYSVRIDTAEPLPVCMELIDAGPQTGSLDDTGDGALY